MRTLPIITGIVVILFSLFLSCGGSVSSMKPNVKYEKKKRINVTVKDDANNPVESATVTMSKKTWPVVEKTTNKEGATTFYEIYQLPFELDIRHGEAYLPQTLTITKKQFPFNKRTADIAVTLERRKTIIVGRIISEETGEPIPNVVTISVYPSLDNNTLETTWKDGTYQIARAQLEEGDEVEINAKIDGYLENFRKITITNYLGINKVPDISLKRNPAVNLPPPDTGKIEIPTTGTIIFSFD